MRGRSNLLWMLFGLLAVMGAVAPAGVWAAADDESRIWSGAVQIPGTELGIALTLTPTDDGGWSGTLDIPLQGIEGEAVGDLEVTETSLAFSLPLPGMAQNTIPVFELEIDESGLKASGVMTQVGQTFPVTLALMSADAVAKKAAERRPQTPRPPFPYREIEVTVPVIVDGALGSQLAGTLTLPDPGEFGEGPFACAVFLTGSGPQDRDETIFEHRSFAVIADALARAGVASLRCDDRGIGESTGDFATADSYDFANDALAQVEFVRERPEIDGDHVGLIGHSEGGLVAAMVAAEHADEVSFVVLLAGMGLTGRETLLGQAAAMLRLSGAPESYVERNSALQAALFDAVESSAPREAQIKAMGALMAHQMGGRAAAIPPAEFSRIVEQQLAIFDTNWMRTLLVIDPAEYLRRVHQPTLAMIGELDVQVLPDENLDAITKAFETAGNQDVTVERLPGLNHLFQNAKTGAMSEYSTIRETFDPEALRILVEWIVNQTSP